MTRNGLPTDSSLTQRRQLNSLKMAALSEKMESNPRLQNCQRKFSARRPDPASGLNLCPLFAQMLNPVEGLLLLPLVHLAAVRPDRHPNGTPSNGARKLSLVEGLLLLLPVLLATVRSDLIPNGAPINSARKPHDPKSGIETENHWVPKLSLKLSLCLQYHRHCPKYHWHVSTVASVCVYNTISRTFSEHLNWKKPFRVSQSSLADSS